MRARVLATVAALAMSVNFASPAYAVGPDTAVCANAGISHHTAGVETADANQKHGVSGTIDGQALHMCTSPGLVEVSASFGWVALGDGGTSGDVIMQLGLGVCRDPLNGQCQDTMTYFYAWGRDASAPGCTGVSHRIASPIRLTGYDGAAHDYKVYHQSNQYRFLVGSTQKTYVPEGDVCWMPNRAWWFSETWDDGDALGGSAGNHLTTALTNYANLEDGGFFWTNLSGSCRFNPAAPYHCQIASTTSFDTWTER